MKKRTEQATFEDLIGLGNQSARKSYYPELVSKLEELERERNRYKWLFENALHGIFQADIAGGIRVANPAIARICGYDSPEQIVAEVSDLKRQLLVEQDDYDYLNYCLGLYGKVFGMETVLRKRDGSEVEVSLNVLLKQEGDSQIIEAFVQDITERRKTQDKLRQLNEELEQRVEERTHELVSLNDKLWREIAEREQIQKELKVAKEVAEQANRSKDRYLAAASHDLLQPMNAARLLVSALREHQLEQDAGHLVERVHLALENAEELLTDLLDISKLDQNAVTPELADHPVAELLAPLVEEFQTVAQDAGLGLRTVPSRLYVHTDARLLVRILRNFLSNAIRYTDKGSVLIGCRRGDRSVRIEVWDTGIGIPRERIDDVFREFHQLKERRGGSTGVGLGLAIVERIARVLEHPIRVSSRPGAGSMFSVEVPLAEAPAPGRLVPEAPPALPDAFDDARILVIDNEESIRLSMAALLTRWGCSVTTAADEIEAISQCREEGIVPDVIVADYHLDAGKTGTEAIGDLRRMFGIEVPAMLITADRSDACRKLFRELGLPVLDKPVKPGKLRALLTFLLREADPGPGQRGRK